MRTNGDVGAGGIFKARRIENFSELYLDVLGLIFARVMEERDAAFV